MIQKIIHGIFIRRHFWRYASFSEISELYASRMLRGLAFNIAASFASIYLYQNGYSVPFIGMFWGIFFLYKAFMAIPMAAVAARIGAKHSIFASNILFIPSMIAFALLPVFGPWLLVVVILSQGTSSTLYAIGYNIDFSKVKSVVHAGKEIAYMNIIEKVTTGLSPLIGGLIAFTFGPQVVLIIAAVLFMFAAVPLLQTAEQESPHQKLNFKGFPWHLIRSNIHAQIAVGFDIFSSGTAWMLFTAIFIIGVANTNEVYAASGALSSVVLFAALGASYAYGKLIDRHKGKELLKISAIVNAVTHLVRGFTTHPIGVAGVNVANEAATTGYSMAYTRGLFDNADISGERTTYLGLVELQSNLGAALGGFTLFFLASAMNNHSALQVFFLVASGVVLLITFARFPLYRK